MHLFVLSCGLAFVLPSCCLLFGGEFSQGSDMWQDMWHSMRATRRQTRKKTCRPGAQSQQRQRKRSLGNHVHISALYSHHLRWRRPDSRSVNQTRLCCNYYRWLQHTDITLKHITFLPSRVPLQRPLLLVFRSSMLPK